MVIQALQQDLRVQESDVEHGDTATMANHSVWLVALRRLGKLVSWWAPATGLEVRGRAQSQFEKWLEQGRTQPWERNCNIRTHLRVGRTTLDSVTWLEPGWDVRADSGGGWLAFCRTTCGLCEFLLAVVLKSG